MTRAKQISTARDKTQIKICGLSTREAVDAAIDAGASHIGLVHFEKSPRHVSLEMAAELRAYADGRVKSVLLLVNASPLVIGQALEVVAPDIIQFHGKETPEWLSSFKQTSGLEIWKAIGVKSPEILQESHRYVGAVDRLLFDAPAQAALPGGTGASFDWSILAQHQHAINWGLAGGLDADNVAEAIRVTGAPLVDVSSGVESGPGIKDVAKIAAFCQAVQHYEQARTDS
jgi:phosphoribosylanthranilate isomerase